MHFFFIYCHGINPSTKKMRLHKKVKRSNRYCYLNLLRTTDLYFIIIKILISTLVHIQRKIYKKAAFELNICILQNTRLTEKNSKRVLFSPSLTYSSIRPTFRIARHINENISLTYTIIAITKLTICRFHLVSSTKTNTKNLPTMKKRGKRESHPFACLQVP